MKKAILAAVVCAAGFLAGCGSSSKTVTKTSTAGATTGAATTQPASNSGMTVGSSGTMGPPQNGAYDLRNNTVLKHLLHMIDVAIAAKGNTNVRGVCRAISSTQAACGVEFTTPQGQVAKVLYTLNVNLQTGHFTVSNVRPLK